jgi:hypothetical protein
MAIGAEQWGGGYYELDVALEGGLSVDTLEALWSHPALDGPFVDDASTKMRRATWDELRTAYAQDAEHLPDCYGIATLHDGASVPCRSFRWEQYVGAGGETYDSLNFMVPANGLRAVWPRFGEFPFVEPEGVRSWQEPLEEWFADIARGMFPKSAVAFARVGFEATTVDPEEWMLSPREPAPAKRGMGVLRREGTALEWYPTTAWGGPVGTTWDGLVDVTPWGIKLRSWLRHRRERRQ